MSLVEQKMKEVTANYPNALKPLLLNNWSRIIWQAEQVQKLIPKGGTVLDLGSGAVPFMALCQALGYKTIMVDDFADAFYQGKEVSGLLDQFRELGVEVVHGDVFAENFAAQFNGLDMVTSHDSMEHWHQSPKQLFHDLWGRLNAGGMFWIAVPNCVNMRKRLTVPFGHGKWSQMVDWYETPMFRGHVREPDVGDLRYIARDMGASKIKITGQNWVGRNSKNMLIRTATPIADRLLRLRPSLCSVIYLHAWK